jgi:hypothetical protein
MFQEARLVAGITEWVGGWSSGAPHTKATRQGIRVRFDRRGAETACLMFRFEDAAVWETFFHDTQYNRTAQLLEGSVKVGQLLGPLEWLK